jgi:hypothetical protein
MKPALLGSPHRHRQPRDIDRKNAAPAKTGHVEVFVSGVVSIADPAAVKAVDPTQA